jgi:hypothetical protein
MAKGSSAPTRRLPPNGIPDPPPAPPMPQFVPPAGHALVDRDVRWLKETLNRIRKVRDDRSYLTEGSHSFREWCMNQFGEKMGAFVEENL